MSANRENAVSPRRRKLTRAARFNARARVRVSNNEIIARRELGADIFHSLFFRSTVAAGAKPNTARAILLIPRELIAVSANAAICGMT